MHSVVEDKDLLTEILLRLAVKDLLRYKCVCKKWLSVISEPQFCNRHTLGLCRNHKLYASGMLLQETEDCLILKKARITPFTNNSNNRFTYLHLHNEFDGLLYYRILQSCNGLLLWDSAPIQWPSPPYDVEVKKFLQGCRYFYISNPSTGHCVRIDQFGYKIHHPNFSNPVLIFEPWKSPHYKIIFFAKVVELATNKMKMNVYSSNTGSWNKVDVLTFPNDIRYFRNNGVYCNGAIHWYDVVDDRSKVYFDIDGLCFKNYFPALPIPPVPPYYKQLAELYLGNSGENLYMIVQKNDDPLKLIYGIWELKKDYSEWIVRFHVDLTTFEAGTFDVDAFDVVRQPPNDEHEQEDSILAILIINRTKLVAYNLKDHSSRILYEEDRFYPPSFHHHYFETLTSILPSY
ncbi:F-box protein At5g07610-like [Arachis ipaensis]|uniref:F-box protein At5g07610-like n=1 Tax=Arachis ipaensis TaxID=130454 RepID=UPI0007AF8892|nr:F-box protein At5g07610-like [Arachis ipaensis]